MNLYRLILLFFISTFTSPIYAEIFKCEDENGVTTFASKPCGKDSSKINIKVTKPKFTKPKITNTNNFARDKTVEQTREHKGISYKSREEANEIANKKANDDASMSCEKRGMRVAYKGGGARGEFRKSEKDPYIVYSYTKYICLSL